MEDSGVNYSLILENYTLDSRDFIFRIFKQLKIQPLKNRWIVISKKN